MSLRRFSEFALSRQSRSETLNSSRAEEREPREQRGHTVSRAPSQLELLRRRTQSESARRLRSRTQSEYVDTARFRAVSKSSQAASRQTRTGSVLQFLTPRPRMGSRKDSSVHAVDLTVLDSLALTEENPEVLEGEADEAKELQASEEEEDFDEENCLICMGRFSKKKPAIPIPCSKRCNLAPVHAKCIYEWKEQKRGAGSCPLCRSDLGDIDYSPPDLLKLNMLVMFQQRKNFCISPVPKGAGMVRCFIKVRNGFFGSPVRYEMYAQAPTTLKYPLGALPSYTSPEKGDRLLLTAHKKLGKWGNSYIDISLDSRGKDFDRNGPNYVGTCHATTSGLEHSLVAPFKSSAHGSNAGGMRELLGVVYTQNRVGQASGPRRMQVALPPVKEVDNMEDSGSFLGLPSQTVTQQQSSLEEISAQVVEEEGDDSDSDSDSDDEDELALTKKYITEVYRPRNKTEHMTSLLRRSKSSNQEGNSDKIIFGQNREPYWLDSIQAFSLDFQGRVTLPSNKNFQLELDIMPESLAMQFGKVVSSEETPDGAAIYTVDVQWPLSPLQAFGLAISACDRKLAVA